MAFRSFSFAVAIASISFSVSLRDVDQEVSEITSETGLLGFLTRTVEKAHANEKHRVELLEEAATFLGRMHSKGSNASIYMSEEQKDMFRNVLNLIEGTIFDSVNQSHDNTVEALANSVDPVQQCDERKDFRIDDQDGDVYQDEHQWQEIRDKHWGCRREETKAYALNDTEWGHFEHYFHNLNRMHKWEFPEPRALHSLNDFFMGRGPVWVQRYYDDQQKYKAFRATWVAAKKALDAKMQQCFMNLTAMNMQYCSYQLGLRDCCIGYKRCRAREVANYHKINATAYRTAASRKKIWKSGVYIIEHVKCLIGERCLDVMPTDDSHYDVSEPSLTHQTPCSISPVEAEVCTTSFEAFLNLTGAYEQQQLLTCEGPTCPTCVTVPSVNRSKDTCTDSHGNYTNKFESDCIFYDDHMRACGRSEYDGTNGFDSRMMCCSCGGGNPPLR